MPSAVRYATSLAIWVLVVLGLMVLVTISKSEAHDWYAGRGDPVTHYGCCGGSDCGPVPLEADWVQPVADGFQVTMTLEQSRLINPNSPSAINTIVPWNRIMSPSSEARDPAIYHICIWGGQLRCLFVVPGL